MKYANLISKEKEEKNKIKSVNKLENIKSNYILKKIFKNLEIQKSLKTVKYNNNIKKRLNINFNDVIEYLEKYSPIELEIKPVNNESCKFINNKKEDEIYYHIYFNNSKKEIKRNYIKNDEKIKVIKIIIDYQITSLENLFYCCDFIESIYFKKFYRSNIINMSGMFYECSSLKELNLNKFRTNNVINMSFMFD